MEENNINELKAEIEALKAENEKLKKECEQKRQWWSEAYEEANRLRGCLSAIGTIIAAIKK